MTYTEFEAEFEAELDKRAPGRPIPDQVSDLMIADGLAAGGYADELRAVVTHDWNCTCPYCDDHPIIYGAINAHVAAREAGESTTAALRKALAAAAEQVAGEHPHLVVLPVPQSV